MKYHLHIVDSGGEASTATAAAASNLASAAPLLFAHFALRCGHLYDVLAVSASTASDRPRAPAAISELTDNEDVADDDTADDPDDQLRVLQAAASVFQSPSLSPDEPPPLPARLRRAVEDAFLPGADWGLIKPYPSFSQPFTQAERLARRHELATATASTTGVTPYFSFIIAADLAAYAYVVQHYQRLRLQPDGDGDASAAHSPVAVLHVMSSRVDRSCHAMQRVMEALLDVQLAKVADHLAEEAAAAAAASDEDVGEEHDDVPVDDAEWMEKIEEAITLSSQVLGTDVLLTIV